MWTPIAPGLRRSVASSASASPHFLVPTFTRINMLADLRSFCQTAVDLNESSTPTTSEEKSSSASSTPKKAGPRATEKTKEEKAEKAKLRAEKEAINAEEREEALRMKLMRISKDLKREEKAKKKKEAKAWVEKRFAEKKEEVRKKNLKFSMKRPHNGFQNYMSATVKGTCKGTNLQDAFYTQIEAWSALSEEEKAKYQVEDYESKLKEHREKYREWKNNLTPNQLNAIRKSRRKGKGIHAFSEYKREHFPREVPEGYSTAESFKEKIVQLLARYRALSEEEKQVYKDRTCARRAQRDSLIGDQ